MIFISVASMLTLNMLEVADRDIPLLTRLPGSRGFGCVEAMSWASSAARWA
jgi:hypothetical protein